MKHRAVESYRKFYGHFGIQIWARYNMWDFSMADPDFITGISCMTVFNFLKCCKVQTVPTLYNTIICLNLLPACVL